MSDGGTPPRPNDPDPVALDELLRAFSIEVPGDAGDPTDGSQGADRTDAEIDAELDTAVDTVLGDTATGGTATGGTATGGTGVDEATAPVDDVESVRIVPRAAPPTPTAPEAPDRRAAPDAPDGPDVSTGASGSRRRVVTIDDGDRPDAVFLKGDLALKEQGVTGGTDISGGSVVFIDDDDTGDAVVPGGSGPLGRRIEPRFRERRIAVRRAEGRRRLRWFVVAGAVLALLVAALAVLGSPLFAIDADEVSVTGAVYTDPVRLQEVVDDLVGTPVLVADTRAAERALEAIPWVDDARVRTSFPNGASIEIRERRALATFQGPDGRFRVIDRDGRVLDVIDGQPIAYMLVTGPDATDVQAGGFAAPGYAAAAELVQGLTSSVRGRVTSIDVTADGSQLTMFLAAPDTPVGLDTPPVLEVRFGAANDLLTKLVRLETVLPIATERGATVIDVSTAEVTVQ